MLLAHGGDRALQPAGSQCRGGGAALVLHWTSVLDPWLSLQEMTPSPDPACRKSLETHRSGSLSEAGSGSSGTPGLVALLPVARAAVPRLQQRPLDGAAVSKMPRTW